MTRPTSIIAFERFFWASMAIGILSTAFAWSAMRATLQQSGSPYGMTSIVVTLVIFGGISVAFWYGIARRGSNIVRWIYIVWMGLGSISTLTSLADEQGLKGVALVASLLSTALTVASIACLFRPDAVAWLTGKPRTDPTIFE